MQTLEKKLIDLETQTTLPSFANFESQTSTQTLESTCQTETVISKH